MAVHVADGQLFHITIVKKVGMRSISDSGFRLFLLAICCTLVLLNGCAKPRRARPTPKPAPLFVDNNSKPQPKDEPQQAEEPVLEGPKLEITQSGVTLRWAEKSGSQMTASARSADFNEITQVGSLIDFSASLYENGKLAASISASKAMVDTAKRAVTATGGVTLKSIERDTVVKAAWIKWDAKTNKVTGNGGVKITSAAGTAEAAAFVADTSLKNYTLLSSGKGLEK
ncbi:MAG: LPS export ABC transporter periplasmic protein LptC [Armatimonadetes bacterium]|nr:LPS export ABC transporter periplasmic protein LptC [Armatimonadota bacterium]